MGSTSSRSTNNGRRSLTQRSAKDLVVSGCGGDSRRYRANHLLEILEPIGGAGMVLDSQQLLAGTPGCFITLRNLFHRVTWNDSLQALSKALSEPASSFFSIRTISCLMYTMTRAAIRVWKIRRGQAVSQQLRTMQACRLVIASTDYLKRAEDFGIEAHTLHNGYSAQMLRSPANSCARTASGWSLNASGTPS